MQIEFTGRQTGVPPRLRALAAQRLKKLSWALRGMAQRQIGKRRERKRESGGPVLAGRRA